MTATDERAPGSIDWDVALATARRVASPGPSTTSAHAATVVEELRANAVKAGEHVRVVTGLDGGDVTAPVLVVDRIGWAQANMASMDGLVSPLVDRMRERKPSAFTGVGSRLGSKITGVEAGTLLGFLSSKVLGQFDPFYADGGAVGRLLLVAPNVVQVERELRVDPADFRLWVCLHEETHRIQFTAVPWLRDHMRAEIQAFITTMDLDAAELLARFGDVARGVVEAIRSEARGETDGPSLLDLVQTPAQRAAFDRITAVMSLLEGHADVVMDAVGPDVVPSVAVIRRRFQQRRRSPKGTDRVLRRLLGMEAKLRQYRDGAAFVRTVIDEVGMTGFNRVWESASTLPTAAEIADPSAWVRRVHHGA